jgi:predicted O-methyltransferase YrrM
MNDAQESCFKSSSKSYMFKQVNLLRKFRTPSDLKSIQIQMFKTLGLNYHVAVQECDRVFAEHSLLRRDPSQHYELFASLKESLVVRRILEIGTFEGHFTRFLSCLFPEAEILTIDLPQRAASTGNRSRDVLRHYNSNFENERMERRSQLRNCVNVTQMEADSALLHRRSDTFDLIWIDGDHKFPVLAWDFINSLRLLAPAGVIAVDDILQVPAPGRSMGGDEGYQCIQRAVEAGIVSSGLIEKRIDNSSRLTPPDKRKRVAVLKSTELKINQGESS